MPEFSDHDKIAAHLSKAPKFRAKSPRQQRRIVEAVEILKAFGVSVEVTAVQLDAMAVFILALADVRPETPWAETKDLDSMWAMSTREMIAWVNEHYNQNMSSGSYDDVRRKHTLHARLAGLIVRSKPNASTNDSTRGYSLNPLHAAIFRQYGANGWVQLVSNFMNTEGLNIAEVLAQKRNLTMMPVSMPDGNEIQFTPGEHNLLQKEIIEKFLPRYGYGTQVLYVGDTANKHLYKNKEKLTELCFFDLSDKELPDIVAYSAEKNWVYLIEAVHSSGPFKPERLLEMQKGLKGCKGQPIFITAFLTRTKFRTWVANIAWETEVWIADEPDHLIHFNGERFLGPYPNPQL